MGWMLWTKYLHPESPVVFERDDGFTGEDHFADLAFAAYKDFYKIERQCLAQVQNGGVLDVGTGAGRASLYFQNRGIDVLAVDLSPGACLLAQTRGVLQVKQLSVFDLQAVDAAVSAIVMIGNGTTVAQTLPELGDLLRHLRKIAGADTQLMITSLDIYADPEHFHTSYHAEKKRQGRYPGEFSLRYRVNGIDSAYLSGVLVDPSTLASLLHQTGWPVRRRVLHANETPLYGMIAG